MMSDLESYLKQVRKGMRFVSGFNKTSFCNELAAQAEYTGTLPSGDGKALGRAMRQVYGISIFFRILLIVTAFPLGLLSTPMIVAWFPDFPATLFLLLALLWVLLAAYYGGRWSGLFTGLSAAIPRLVALVGFTFALDFINQYFDSYQVSEGVLGAVVLTSIMLPIIGFLAGGRIRRPD